MAEKKERVKQLLDKIAKEQNFINHRVEMLPICSDGTNFSALLYTAIITGDNREPLHIFAKANNLSEKMLAQLPYKPYESEILCFTHLVKIFEQLEEKHKIPKEHRFVFPKYYGSDLTRTHEILLLENLSTKGFMTYDRYKSIDWSYAESTCTELAKFHALSMAYQAEYPEEFAEIVDRVQPIWETEKDGSAKNFWKPLISSTVDITREENKASLQKYFDDGPWDYFGEPHLNYCKRTRRVILGHGEFRPSNMMYKINDNGKLQVVLIDYQTLTPSSPVFDLIYMMVASTDGKFRSEYYEKMVDCYYSELSAALRRLHLDPDQIYSREDYDLELKEILPVGLGLALFLLTVITREGSYVPAEGDDIEMNYFNSIKHGELYVRRYNELVDSYVKWGVLKNES